MPIRVGTQGLKLMRTPAVAAGAPAWTPATPSGLVGWYKADVQTYTTGTTQATNGQTIATWKDQSVNGNDLTVQFTSAPVYIASGLGGLPSVLWTSANGERILTVADSVAMGTGTKVSVFVLGSLTASAGYNVGVAYVGTGISPALVGTNANSATIVLARGDPGFTWAHTLAEGTAEAVTASTATRMGMIFDGTNAIAYKNNVPGATDVLSFNWTSPGTLIVGGGGSAGWDGYMREVIIYNTDLGGADRTAMDAYLVSRS